MKITFLPNLLILALLSFGVSITVSGQTSLADQVVGVYKGKLRNSSVDLNNYKIKIIKVSDLKVKIQPKTGNQSQSFELELEEQTMGSIKVIKFKMPGNHLMNNGMFAETNGRLSYGLHLGGDDVRNIEVFAGKKE